MAGFDGQAAGQGAMAGATMGAALAAPTGGLSVPVGALLGATAGLGMGFMGGKKGPDYSKVTDLYNKRQAQIGAFAANLARARAKYMTSLNNMYNDAYSRFSGNAEAGFASRGMSVSGGAFASTLAKEAGRMSFEGANLAAGMEREDLYGVDKAYGANSGSYMSAISGGPGQQFSADREDMRSIGGFAGKLAMQYASSKKGADDFGSDGSYWTRNSNGGYNKLGLGESWNG